MAEGLFAIANLFSFIRICFLMPANQQLGPLQISLGNMISVSLTPQTPPFLLISKKFKHKFLKGHYEILLNFYHHIFGVHVCFE